jgi:hypothetical protein
MAVSMYFTAAVFCIGLLLLAISLVISPQSVSAKWTEADAAAYAKASNTLHRLSYEAAGAKRTANNQSNGKSSASAFADSRLAKSGDAVDPATTSPERLAAELAKAREDCERLDAALIAARESGDNRVALLRWTGAILVVLGIVGSVISQRKAG